MAKKRDFLKQYFQEKKMVGAIAPSSRFLANKMVQTIELGDAKIVVELGPGTGVFTKKILKQLPEDGKLIAFELNELFYERLKKEINDDRLILVNDSAEKIQEYLTKYNFTKADYVLSALPLANFPDELRMSVLTNCYAALKKNGKYIQFQYSLQSKKYMKEVFDEMSIKFQPLNLPPAFVYSCSKK